MGVKCLNGESVVHGVPHAGSFFVFEGDFFGTGVLPPPGGGNALIDHGWEVREVRESPDGKSGREAGRDHA